MKNLISMVDFVLDQDKNNERLNSCFLNCVEYAKFLKRPVELWMFVPCDEDGNVLEEPICQEYALANQKYQQAKERCLFEGFVQNEDCKYHIYNSSIEIQFSSFSKINQYIHVENFTINNPELIQIFTIEDLVKYNLKLIPTALKQIGL